MQVITNDVVFATAWTHAHVHTHAHAHRAQAVTRPVQIVSAKSFYFWPPRAGSCHNPSLLSHLACDALASLAFKRGFAKVSTLMLDLPRRSLVQLHVDASFSSKFLLILAPSRSRNQLIKPRRSGLHIHAWPRPGTGLEGYWHLCWFWIIYFRSLLSIAPLKVAIHMYFQQGVDDLLDALSTNKNVRSEAKPFLRVQAINTCT
jgi:hypothetical protein